MLTSEKGIVMAIGTDEVVQFDEKATGSFNPEMTGGARVDAVRSCQRD